MCTLKLEAARKMSKISPEALRAINESAYQQLKGILTEVQYQELLKINEETKLQKGQYSGNVIYQNETDIEMDFVL